MRKGFLVGFVCAIILIGCVSFSYERFGLQLNNTIEDSKLLHHDSSSKDLPLEACRATDASQCVVLFGDEFYRLKEDYESCIQKLTDCQKNCKAE